MPTTTRDGMNPCFIDPVDLQSSSTDGKILGELNFKGYNNIDWKEEEEEERWQCEDQRRNCWRLRYPKFPPPISCIGRSKNPWVQFESIKGDGRFVLKEFRTATSGYFLRVTRKDGRLTMHIVQLGQEPLDQGNVEKTDLKEVKEQQQQRQKETEM